MKSLLLPLLLAVTIVGIAAQASPHHDLIDRSKVILAMDPADSSERLGLAYHLMLSGFPDLALLEYRQVLDYDASNKQAQTGILWALNSLGDWQDSARQAQSFNTGSSDSGWQSYYRADALLRLGRPYQAAQLYRQTAEESADPLLQQYSRRGFSWAFSNLGDYPRSVAQLEQLPDLDMNYPLEFIRHSISQAHYYADIRYGIKDTETSMFAASASLGKRSLAWQLGFEELRISGTHFRWSANAGVTKQFLPLDVGISLRYLDGEDTRIYSGKAFSAVLMPKLYFKALRFTPRLVQHTAVFQRFNVYQSDIGLGLESDPGAVSYVLSSVYQDSEAISADSSHLVHTLSGSLRLARNAWLGLYAGLGDLAWFTTAGGIVDDFLPVDSYLGASLYIPLWRNLAATFYYQYGARDDDPSQYMYARLSYGA